MGRLYSDPEEMFAAEQIDLVSICTPAPSHFSLLEVVLRHEIKGVLIEKPLAQDLESAKAMLALNSGLGTKVAVNYIRRYPPVYRQAIADVQNGHLGNIQHVNILYTKGILNNGTHVLDLLRAFWGDPTYVKLVSAGPSPAADPTLSAAVGFTEGFEARLTGVDGDAYNIFEMDIVGTEGRMIFTDLGHALYRYPVEDTRPAHGFRQLASQAHSQATELAGAARFAIEDVIESIETDSQPACVLQDGYNALDLALQLVNAAAAEPGGHHG